MNYSNKIKFKDIKVKNSKFKLTIVNIMIFILTITAVLVERIIRIRLSLQL